MNEITTSGRTEQYIPPVGYVPHGNMAHFTCPFCGHGEFTMDAQSVPTDGRKWTYEYRCARCNRMIGLTMKAEISI